MDFLNNQITTSRMKPFRKKHPAGFTLTELCVTLAVVGILGCIAVPAFYHLREGYKLHQAARDLYSNMQRAKIATIKDQSTRRILFIPDFGQQGYAIWSEGPNHVWDKATGDDILETRVYFSDYDMGITFGQGNAKYAATTSKGKIPANGISYNEQQAHFNPNITVGELGYVYLRNQKGENYAIGTKNRSGFIVFKKWQGNCWN